LKVVDLFCGAGGFSEGFRQAGFDIVLGVDNWQPAINTHHANHPNAVTLLDDVKRLSTLPDNEFHKIIPNSEVIIGSPPCVDFSNSNRSGKADKTRGIRLIESFLRIVARKKYQGNSCLKYWLLENVHNVQNFVKPSYTAKELGLEGNFILEVKNRTSGIYNAKYYGVPSRRKRYICGDFPEPKRTIECDSSLISLKHVLNSLGEPKESLESIVVDPNYSFSMISKEMTDHHYIQQLAEFQWKKAKRLKEDKGYMGRMAFPEDVHRPARTIMATLSFSARESMIFGFKRNTYRAPTIREIASLMSFPIDYRFYGETLKAKYRLVGNAVPPKMAFAFAKAILDQKGSSSNFKYRPKKYKDDLDFYNLDFQIFHIEEEKPKSPIAKFKYHIPYLKMNTFRVELTNHHSNFENFQFIWDVEIHKSQGPRAKVFTRIVQESLFSDREITVIKEYCSSLNEKLVNYNDFQKQHCLTEDERKKGDLLGPFELLNKVREFIDTLMNGSDRIDYLDISDEPYLLPRPIAIGYFVLQSFIKKMSEVNNGRSIEDKETKRGQ
jgi:DNA (cytosine-5)-methyltransferase 1